MHTSNAAQVLLRAARTPLLFAGLAVACTKENGTTAAVATKVAAVADIILDAPGIAPTLQQRDSIPVALFDSSAFTKTTQLLVDSVPLAVLGARDSNPDFDLTHVDWAMLLSDNTVVTSSRMTTRLLVFDSTGRALRVLARFGGGPGDMGRRQELTRASHDTLVTADFSMRRVNRYSAEKFVRMTPIGSVVDERADQLAGVLSDGTLLLHSAGSMPDQFDNGRTRVNAVLMLMDTRGLTGVVAQVPDITVATMRTNWEGKRRRMPLPLRLGPKAQIVVWDSLIATENGEAYRIDLRNDRGRVISALEVTVAPRVVTPAIRDADLAARMAEFEEMGGESSMGNRLQCPARDGWSPDIFGERNTRWIR